MAVGVPSRLRSYLRRKLEKSRKCTAPDPSTNINTTEKNDSAPPTPYTTVKPIPIVPTPRARFDEQQNSSFFQKLPFEIRSMIYAYVWQGTYDHMYHESNGRHLHFKHGHWVSTRCVMYQEDDEDTDMIQKQMDIIRHSGIGDLLMWQRRLASTWGQRHWRCAERIEYGRPTSIDRTDLGALMVTCKKMHPEVIQSFLECHKIIFNDLFSAHRFLAPSGRHSPLIRHIRKLELTFSVPFHEFTPFMVIGCPDTDDHRGDAAERTTSLAKAKSSRLGAVFAAVAEHPTCLHSLRISLDVYDRGPWRKLPERTLALVLERIPVRRGKRGESNYTLELPPALPIRTHYTGLQELEEDDENGGKRATRAPMSFHVMRRMPLRYWQFNPGEVEHFVWETCQGEKREHCYIALSKTARLISNPYLVDFTQR
ncbi:hypothetical protein F5B22DRAFT_377208 [Xylaria bambusicola]|uniref:uncharacterized protein n=1 Tax=Xylaria bambusicola TaxID=326684 RepID=UPI002008CB8D|nr:uncharacterized protein F5B22DRAFT_377208 [Xylaria bambusicola]KAI0508840.1 hypothetical protein F5B22DRAFT_377208 [Xylaria bambusicola]